MDCRDALPTNEVIEKLATGKDYSLKMNLNCSNVDEALRKKNTTKHPVRHGFLSIHRETKSTNDGNTEQLQLS